MITTVYISNSDLKILVGRNFKSANNFVIEKTYSQKISKGAVIGGIITDSNLLYDDVHTLLIQSNLQLKNIELVIDSGSVMTRRINLPPANKKNILKLVENEYSDVINANLLIFGYTVINKNDDETLQILAFAVEYDFIKTYTDIFDRLGVTISTINPSLNSIIRLNGISESLKNKTHILAVMDENMLVCILFVNGKYHFSKNRSRFIEERGSHKLALEIRGIISSFLQFNKSEKSGDDITDVYFCGMRDDEMGMLEFISESLNIFASILPNIKEIISAKKDTFCLSDYIYNSGGLIKQSDINFYKKLLYASKKSKNHSSHIKMMAPFGISFFIIILGAVISNLRISGINKKLDFLESPDYIISNAEFEYINEKFSVLSNELSDIEDINKIVSDYDTNAKEILSIINNSSDINIDNIEYSVENQILSISAHTDNNDIIAEFIEYLYNTDYFEKIDYNGYTKTAKYYSFDVKCYFKTEGESFE